MSFIEPNEPNTSKDFAVHMIRGLLDHVLELGYFTAFHVFAKEGRPIYRRCHQAGEDHVTIEFDEFNPEVDGYVFRIIRRDHDANSWYKVHVRLDFHFQVKGLEVESPSHTALEIATNLHRVFTSARCGYHWNGERRSMQEISDMRVCNNL